MRNDEEWREGRQPKEAKGGKRRWEKEDAKKIHE
jgi:hypothetical protein